MQCKSDTVMMKNACVGFWLFGFFWLLYLLARGVSMVQNVSSNSQVLLIITLLYTISSTVTLVCAEHP
jgi:hypothetical protein